MLMVGKILKEVETYKAEWKFESQYPHITKKLTLKECQSFAKRVMKSKLWEQFNHKNDLAVRLRSACKTSPDRTDEIKLFIRCLLW